MGIVARALGRPPLPPAAGIALSPSVGGVAQGGGYEHAVREGYAKNELIFAAIELRATSAAEPKIIGRRYLDRARASQKRRRLQNTGMPAWAIHDALIQDRFVEEAGEDEHPIVRLLNHPNPYMSRFNLWATMIMDRDLAGNAYLYKARARPGDITSPVLELWRLRPDRIRVVPDADRFVGGYQYRAGRTSIDLAPEDVIHFKARHPLNEYYGMPPLMAASERVDIDNWMRNFVGAFFRNGGAPGAVLTVKGALTQEAKDRLRERHRTTFGGSGGWFDLMIIEQSEATYTPITMQLGQRGLVVPELSAINEARIAMIFGVPLSLLGALAGQESSSYANKRQDWQVLWDSTLAPLYSELDDTLTLGFMAEPQFRDLDELVFDLSDVKALQEDVDKLHDRARSNFSVGLWTLEEARNITGVSAQPEGMFFVPAAVIPTEAGRLGERPPAAEIAARAAFAMAAPPATRARLLYERGEEVRREHPEWSFTEIADALGISERSYRRHRADFA